MKINKKQIVVRANAQVGLNALDDPIPYQNFFNALECLYQRLIN